MTMIHVANLSDDTDASRLRSLFRHYGAVVSMRLEPGVSGHRFDGFGLVEMETSTARKAIAELDGRVLDGAILSVREATESQQPGATPVPVPAMRDDEPPRAIMRRPCKVAEVEKVKGPGGADGDDWYRYVIDRGTSRITGFHRGTLAEVTEYAAECAEAFSERRQHGKYPNPFAPSRKK